MVKKTLATFLQNGEKKNPKQKTLQLHKSFKQTENKPGFAFKLIITIYLTFFSSKTYFQKIS